MLFVAGLALILWQAVAFQVDGTPAEQPFLYVGMALIGAGLGWKWNLK